MATIFNFDWFSGPAYAAQRLQARQRVIRKRFPDVPLEELDQHADAAGFYNELEARTLLYLRDGFSYEMKELVDIGQRNNVLTFECEPIDDQYKVGAFIVSVPNDEIVRVEVYAVHPKEKPEDVPLITGFRGAPPDAASLRDDREN